MVYVEIQAKANGYYMASEIGEANLILQRGLTMPTVENLVFVNGGVIVYLNVHEHDDYLNISLNENNQTYDINILEIEDTWHKVDITEFLTNGNQYLKIYTSSQFDGVEDSQENSILIQNKGQLGMTEIISGLVGDDLEVEWSTVANAKTYEVYFNGILYATTQQTSYTIDSADIVNGEYSIGVKALGYIQKNSSTDFTIYSDSQCVIQENNGELEAPISISTQKISSGFNITWNTISLAQKYIVYVDNQKYESTTNSLSVNYGNQSPCQIIIQSYRNGDCSPFSKKVMYNPSDVTIVGYTDKFIMLNGWQDYYATTEREIHILLKHLFFSYSERISMVVSSDIDINESNKNSFVSVAKDDFGTCSFSYSTYLSSHSAGKLYTVYMSYSNGTDTPPTTYTESSNTPLASQGYYHTTSPTRDENYNDFATEKSLITVEVGNTNQLYMCAEDGAKPVFKTQNYQAEQCYEECKRILRLIIDDNMTEYQKALAIYDYINYTSVYDSNYTDGNFANTRYWLNGPLLYGVGVCDGFSKLYSLMCGMEGLTVTKISGIGGSGGHAWNQLYIDAGDGVKRWYNVDLTWDGPTSSNVEYMTHRYFLLSDEDFVNHTAESPKHDATTTFNYYDNYATTGSYDLYITSIAELKAYLLYLNNNREIINATDVYINISGYTSSTIGTAFKTALSGTGLSTPSVLTLGDNVYLCYYS